MGLDTHNLVWPAHFKASCEVLGKNQVIVIYCRSGNRAGAAITYLDSLGYENIYNAGGFSTWTGAKILASDTMHVSDLPEPSMKAEAQQVTNNYMGMPTYSAKAEIYYPLCDLKNGIYSIAARGLRMNIRGQVIQKALHVN